MWLTSWLLMSFAMMVPATLPAVRHVALNSIDARRARAMTLYVAAYLAVWGLFGVVAFALFGVSRTLFGFATTDRVLLAIVLVIATVWQLTRIKRRAIVACKRTVPLPPDGLRADRACMRFGMMQAWRCLLACWPLMLLMAAMPHPHPLLPMIALTAIVLVEERARNRDRLIVPIAGVLAAAAVTAMVAEIAAR
jgi:predicted metal-binding membrane protein